MAELYYTPPTDEQFLELKTAAIEIWADMQDSHENYRNEKIGRIRDIQNVSDNFMYMVAMFDSGNQKKLADKLSAETRLSVKERMLEGGNPEFLIPF